ncbi:hypothetical protein RFI_30763 [Reticulomyxa filosa]|uniref:Uncharacterized protein n=1 Tax=Reticulomyxa filosa TaxID=46433 RepID=X6LXE9_RETFI|nr:hypothetical protein RFI_30763 [Reticulomyxa filosa]|eukprot:ETO06628.1 hypothetical protein RFI_30763 [Reticulomyxa filosa]
MERAVKHFHSIYQRDPSEEESAKLCKFLTTGDLPSIGSDDEKEDAENTNPNVKKLTFNESDDDSDSEYNPEKDTTCNEEKDAAEESENMADLANEENADLNLVK